MATTMRSTRFPAWKSLRPYFYAVVTLAIADLLMYFGDRYLVQYGFPWALVSLLVIAAVASFWGLRPALLVLILSALTGDMIAPDLRISYLSSAEFPWHIRLMRTLLFAVCGATLMTIAWRARVMSHRAALRRLVVQSLQKMVLPETLPIIHGYDIGAIYRPSRQEEEVGGDFYDVFPVNSERKEYGILIGDVMGKGKEAAEHTALLRYATRVYAGEGFGPAETLRRLNCLIEAQQMALSMASLFMAILDSRTGRIRYANGGHEAPLMITYSGEERYLSSTGPLIGIMSEPSYQEMSFTLSLNDSLLMVTDGVTEARDPQGIFLDDTGVSRLFHHALKESTVAGALEQFTEELDRFMAGNQRDDVAILLIRRRSSSATPTHTFLPASSSKPVTRV